MKHIFFILGFFLFQTGILRAADAPIPTPFLQSFYSRFAEAADVQWEQNGKLTVASFYLNGRKQFAYYNEAAELVVLAEPVTVNELPERLKKSLQKKFCNDTLSALFQLKDGQGSSYHAVFESAKKKVFARSHNQQWEVEKSVFK